VAQGDDSKPTTSLDSWLGGNLLRGEEISGYQLEWVDDDAHHRVAVVTEEKR
jgi:hypothetical protein